MSKTTIAQQVETSNFLPSAQRVLQRKCACGNQTLGGGECAECGKKKRGLQRKLTIGASNDPLEREADRVADQVMAAPVHSAVSDTPLRIQRYAKQATESADTAPASVDNVLASSGRPLESTLLQDMEQRFGRDFSQVRVHSGVAAEQSARDVSADAYTAGNNIVFGAGQLAPRTHEGRRLIAHELTHVVQQSGAERVRASQSNEKYGKHSVVYRRVATRLTNCPAGTNNAPADPVGELSAIDAIAAALVSGTAILLSITSALTRVGFRNPASAVDQAYQNTFGLPPARPGGFLNRLTGVVRSTLDEALSEEMRLLSLRYGLLGRFFSQFVPYRCGIPETFGGCTQTAADCAGDDAGACPGVGAIFLCPGFWGYGTHQQAGILIHEAAHVNWARIDHGAQGPGGNFRHAECYAEFVAQIFPIVLPPTTNPCIPPGP